DRAGNVEQAPASPDAQAGVAGASATLRRNGGAVELIDAASGRVIATRLLTDTRPLVIAGTNAKAETLTVSFASGEFKVVGGIRFDAGTGTGDRFILTGNAATTNVVITAGEPVKAAGNTITLTGVETQQVSNVAALTLNTAKGNGTFTVDRPAA